MYKFFEDPGHGWLQVPIKEVVSLGIAEKVSGYSYRYQDQAYLEEDCDYALFYDAYKKEFGVKPEYETIEVSYDTPIRQFERWTYKPFLKE
tara:strand:+ start:315 stop:587 length:273 start_codon:yes stop_codon:yes gene_type:complete